MSWKYPHLRRGLLRHWYCGTQAQAVMPDWSGNNDHAVMAGFADNAAAWVGSDNGYAIDLDGTDSRMTCETLFTPTAHFTASVWVLLHSIVASEIAAVISAKPYVSTDNFGIWAYQAVGNWYIQVCGSGTDIQADTGKAYALNTWTHLCLVYRPTSPYVEFYVNGVSVYTSTNNPGTLTARGLDIGSYDVYIASESLDGLIDDVAIWDRPLQPQEISQLALRRGILAERDYTPEWLWGHVAAASTPFPFVDLSIPHRQKLEAVPY